MLHLQLEKDKGLKALHKLRKLVTRCCTDQLIQPAPTFPDPLPSRPATSSSTWTQRQLFTAFKTHTIIYKEKKQNRYPQNIIYKNTHYVEHFLSPAFHHRHNDSKLNLQPTLFNEPPLTMVGEIFIKAFPSYLKIPSL